MEQAKETPKKTLLVIGLIVGLLILLGLGGFFAFRWFNKPTASSEKPGTTSSTNSVPKTKNAAPKPPGTSTSNKAINTPSNPPTNPDAPGPLDTDVPWREEGEPDLDYSNLVVRACGASIKGPPEISPDQETFEQEYQEYLDWVTEDCQAAYREAGQEPPF